MIVKQELTDEMKKSAVTKRLLDIANHHGFLLVKCGIVTCQTMFQTEVFNIHLILQKKKIINGEEVTCEVECFADEVSIYTYVPKNNSSIKLQLKDACNHYKLTKTGFTN